MDHLTSFFTYKPIPFAFSSEDDQSEVIVEDGRKLTGWVARRLSFSVSLSLSLPCVCSQRGQFVGARLVDARGAKLLLHLRHLLTDLISWNEIIHSLFHHGMCTLFGGEQRVVVVTCLRSSKKCFFQGEKQPHAHASIYCM